MFGAVRLGQVPDARRFPAEIGCAELKTLTEILVPSPALETR